RYQAQPEAEVTANELAFVRLRYKQPDASRSQLIERPVTLDDSRRMSSDFRFAAAVAAFGQRLRGGQHLNGYEFADIARLARRGVGRDAYGYRGEFLDLVEQAHALTDRVALQEVRDPTYHVAN
ncbi:MAG: DUF3520 domain-containing protein, partial [Gammaproteobacteria bacterium]|nr:DUF3520 domain-containing protein [Gammaproteobacteria bacterium]